MGRWRRANELPWGSSGWAAKGQVTALLGEFGWPPHRVLDLGGIRSARSVEMVLPLWLDLFRKLGHGDFNLEVRRAR